MEQTQAPVKAPGVQYGIGPNSAALRDGMSSLEVGAMATRAALQWIWRWGWSSPSIVDYVSMDAGRRGKAARMIERKLVKVHTPTSWAVDTPRKILTLTDYGKEELFRLDCDIDIIMADHAIKWGQIRHDYAAQHIVAWMMVMARQDGKPFTYASGPELTMRHHATRAADRACRIPDAIFTVPIKAAPAGEAVALEIELSSKDTGEMHRAVRGLCELYSQRKISRVWLVSTSKAILRSYATLMRPGMKLQMYQRTPARTWSRSGVKEIKEAPPMTGWHLSKPGAEYYWAEPGHLIYPGLMRWQPPPLPPVQVQRDLLDEREREPEPDPDEYDYYEPQVKSPFGRQ